MRYYVIFYTIIERDEIVISEGIELGKYQSIEGTTLEMMMKCFTFFP